MSTHSFNFQVPQMLTERQAQAEITQDTPPASLS